MSKKTKDLSPRFIIPASERELAMTPGEMQMGERLGGLSMFGNSLKRGYGETMFGVDERGVWLGAADFDDAKIKFFYNGAVSIINGDNSSSFDADTLIFYEAGVPVIVIGEV